MAGLGLGLGLGLGPGLIKSGNKMKEILRNDHCDECKKQGKRLDMIGPSVSATVVYCKEGMAFHDECEKFEPKRRRE